MTIEELRASLADKEARGVKQVRVSTMLAELPASAEDAFPAAAKAPPVTLGRIEKALVERAGDNPIDYDGVIVRGLLVGTAEAAAMLGVERPRIGRWLSLGSMPPPVAENRAGPVWLRSQIEAMREGVEARRKPRRHERSPGGFPTPEEVAEREARHAQRKHEEPVAS